MPLGVCRNSQGTVDTDKLFTGQRLDDTGLYFYNARYYDATIGRFISPDTIVPNPANPQTLNRYSYCLNNPLKYIDPTGHWSWAKIAAVIAVTIVVAVAVIATAGTLLVAGGAMVAVTGAELGIGTLTISALGVVAEGEIGLGTALAVVDLFLGACIALVGTGGVIYLGVIVEKDIVEDILTPNSGTGTKSSDSSSSGWVWTDPDIIDSNGIGYTFEERNSGSSGSSAWTGGWEWTSPDVIDSNGIGYTFEEWSDLYGAGESSGGSSSGSDGGSGIGAGVGGSDPDET